MNNKFVLTRIKEIKTGFLFDDNKPVEIRCYEDDSLLGNVYVGRVSNILHNIGSAFIDIQKGLSCYYPLEDYYGEKPLKIGDLLTVQVIKDQIKTKQPTVTTNISLTGEYIVVSVDSTIGVSSKITENAEKERLKKIVCEAIKDFENTKKCSEYSYGAIIRTKASEVDDDIIKNETIKILCELDELMYSSKYSTQYYCLKNQNFGYLADIGNMMSDNNLRIITDCQDIINECYDAGYNKVEFYNDESIDIVSLYGLKTILSKIISKRAYLKSGAYLVIEQTEAMTVIDVNSGKSIKGKNKEEIVYKLNCEAAYEIARQLRLRNLSGIIIIDFISMKNSSYNQQLLDVLKNAVYDDVTKVTVVDITKLGLVEVTRKKIRKPIHEVFKNL